MLRLRVQLYEFKTATVYYASRSKNTPKQLTSHGQKLKQAKTQTAKNTTKPA
jgi:hypothetical protein